MGKNTQETIGRGRRGRDGVKRGGRVASREFSSGGVVFKKENGNVLWLVTASSPNKLFPNISWRLPKGWIDNQTPDTPGPMASGKAKADEESLQKAALREVAEEGGIEAKIIKKIETSFYSFPHPTRGKIMKFVTFYLMEWQKDLPEGHDLETSEVVWLSFAEAYKKLSFGGEKQMLKKAKELLSAY